MIKFTPIAVAVLAAASLAGGALAMTQDEYKAEKARIEAQYKTEKARCNDQLQGNAREVCKEQAEGAEDVAEAELKARRQPGPRADYEVAKEKAEASHDVAKAKCGGLAAAEQGACRQGAKDDYAAAKQALGPKPAR